MFRYSCVRFPPSVTSNGGGVGRHHGLQVRQAREDSSLRIRTLEDSLSRLAAVKTSGGSSAAATVELARALGEAERAARAEARMASEVSRLEALAAAHAADALEARALVSEREKALAELWVQAVLDPAAVGIAGVEVLARPDAFPALPPVLLSAGSWPQEQDQPQAQPSGGASGSLAGPASQERQTGREAMMGQQPAAPTSGTQLRSWDDGQQQHRDRTLRDRLRAQFGELARRQALIAELSAGAEAARREADAAAAELAMLRASTAPDPRAPRDAQVPGRRYGEPRCSLASNCTSGHSSVSTNHPRVLQTFACRLKSYAPSFLPARSGG
jgi:hypothetical protein